jgi:predicted DNA-binding transcriptional regulator YafY
MYRGEEVNITLRGNRSMVGVVLDRFGQDLILIPDGEDHFNFTVPVAVSPMFLSWVIGFGNKAKILYPQSVAEQCRDLCRETLSQY